MSDETAMWTVFAGGLIALALSWVNVFVARRYLRLARRIAAQHTETAATQHTEARSELRRIADDMRRIEREASARVAESRRPFRLTLTRRDTETGLWCSRCNLASGVRITYSILSDEGVTPDAMHQRVCLGCEQPLEPERTEP